MKNLTLFLIGLSCLPILAQGLGTETYTLSPEPWSGDWIPEKFDIMVDGEDYHGWPGPLPKLWYALGVDADHPSSEFEQRERVDRNSPHWFGTCNGWAAAATLFPEPESLVIGGVKLFSGEVKGILASVWKDNIEITLGNYDSQGLTADSVEGILYQFIAANRPVIFDVVLGIESWNYPVVSFTRTATENGAWTDVDLTIRYANSVQMSLLEGELGSLRYIDIHYTYRYNAQGTYQWTGESVTNRPQRAWFTNVPYLHSWYTRANRHFNMNTYETIHDLDRQNGNLKDRFEPNNRLVEAYNWRDNLAMAVVHPSDSDFFKLEKIAGQETVIKFKVYDGSDVDVNLLDANGEVLEAFSAICSADLIPGNDYDGIFYIEIHPRGQETSFYDLQYEQERGFITEDAGSDFVGGTLKVISIRESHVTVSGEDVQVIAPFGDLTLPGILADQTYSADGRVVMAVENVDSERVYKRYDRGHDLRMPYIVPQLTCRNGWKTNLHLVRTNTSPVSIYVYGINGNLVEEKALPEGSDFDLGNVLTHAASAQGTWFELKTATDNKLSGLVTFSSEELDYRADYAIGSRPRNGEMMLSNIPLTGEGWVGISLVNISGVVNPIKFRLLNEKGNILEEGDFELAPNQKWMGLPANLLNTPIGEKYTLWFFAQFNLETLALYHDARHNLDYSQRLPNPILDFTTETYATPSLLGLENQSMLVLNASKSATYVTFRGFNSSGEEILTYRLGGAPMVGFDLRFFTMDQLYAAAGVDPLNSEISHFKITSSGQILVTELLGLPGQISKTSVPLVSIFEKP